MTAGDLIDALTGFNRDQQVVLVIGTAEAEEFTVETDDDVIVLEGDR